MSTAFPSTKPTTLLMPAFTIFRLHIIQGAGFAYSPVDVSFPTMYNVEPLAESLPALVIALSSACIATQSSYLSPLGMCNNSLAHCIVSQQFFSPRGEPLYPVLIISSFLTSTAPYCLLKHILL